MWYLYLYNISLYPLSHHIHITDDYVKYLIVFMLWECTNCDSYNVFARLILRYLVKNKSIFDFLSQSEHFQNEIETLYLDPKQKWSRYILDRDPSSIQVSWQLVWYLLTNQPANKQTRVEMPSEGLTVQIGMWELFWEMDVNNVNLSLIKLVSNNVIIKTRFR